MSAGYKLWNDFSPFIYRLNTREIFKNDNIKKNGISVKTTIQLSHVIVEIGYTVKGEERRIAA